MLAGGRQDDDPHFGVLVGAPPCVIEVLEDAAVWALAASGRSKVITATLVLDVVADEVLGCHGCIPFGGVLMTLSCANDATCVPDLGVHGSGAEAAATDEPLAAGSAPAAIARRRTAGETTASGSRRRFGRLDVGVAAG